MKTPPRLAGMPADTVERLQRLLDEAAPFYKGGVRSAAHDLGVSVDRLESWLNRHAFDFRTLNQYSRWKIAKPLLANPELTLSEIKARSGLTGDRLDKALGRFGNTRLSAAEYRESLGILRLGPTFGRKVSRMPGHEVVSQVHELIRNSPGGSHNQIAALMHCRGQRLTAWLARNGTNFKQLRTKVRVEIASAALRRRIPPGEIAKACGYLDVRSMIASMHKQKRPDLAHRIRAWKPPTEFLLKVQNTIENFPRACMAEIAAWHGCNQKKFGRLLDKECTSFKRIRTEMREAMVEDGLSRGRPFEEIARTCGYLNVPSMKAGIYQTRPDLAPRIRVLTKRPFS